MAKLKANALGVVSGSFQIPANVPAGTKKVAFFGAGGSYGQSTFTGRGSITTELRRRVVTITEYHHDPLAQTFTLPNGRHIVAAEVWFKEKGTKPVYVQIRGVQTGIPTSEVVAQGVIKAADISLSGPTTATFDPVWLEANREYALVVLTDDATHALAIAELGKYDQASGWITQQPYTVGVLLSSSNASTWTPHQDKDLAFRLYGARFDVLTRTVNLGTISAADVTDLVAAATVEQPAADTNVTFIFTQTNGTQFRLAPGQVLKLPAKITDTLQVQAVLSGSAERSPVLYPGTQPILGKLAESASYVSRAMTCGSGVKVAVAFECLAPGTSTVAVGVQKDDGTYAAVPFASATQVGDGWEERRFVLTPFTATNTRVKLTLAGTALFRPRVRKLRVVIT